MLVVVQLLLAVAEFTMVTDPQLDLTTHYSCGFTCPNCFTVTTTLLEVMSMALAMVVLAQLGQSTFYITTSKF